MAATAWRTPSSRSPTARCRSKGPTLFGDEWAKVEAAAPKPSKDNPLAGTIFCYKDTGDRLLQPYIQSLVAAGAIPWGRTTGPQPPAIPATAIPHPFSDAVNVGGSSGGSAFSVACGQSTFSLGTNGGGSNRIPAGLLGVSGLRWGSKGIKTRSGQRLHGAGGFIARTPECVATACAGAFGWGSAFIDRIFKRNSKNTPLDPVRVLAMSNLEPRQAWQDLGPPGTAAAPVLPVHDEVLEMFDAVIGLLNRRGSGVTVVQRHEVPGDIGLYDFTRPFLTKWLASWSRRTSSAPATFCSPPEQTEELVLAPSQWWQAQPEAFAEAQRKADAATTEFVNMTADVESKSKCRFLLTPLLRVSSWPTGNLPKLESSIGNVVDSSMNPFCILSNVWDTPSVTMPAAVYTTVNGERRWLPYGLLLTALPSTADRTETLQDLLVTASHLMIVDPGRNKFLILSLSYRYLIVAQARGCACGVCVGARAAALFGSIWLQIARYSVPYRRFSAQLSLSASAAVMALSCCLYSLPAITPVAPRFLTQYMTGPGPWSTPATSWTSRPQFSVFPTFLNVSAGFWMRTSCPTFSSPGFVGAASAVLLSCHVELLRLLRRHGLGSCFRATGSACGWLGSRSTIRTSS